MFNELCDINMFKDRWPNVFVPIVSQLSGT